MFEAIIIFIIWSKQNNNEWSNKYTITSFLRVTVQSRYDSDHDVLVIKWSFHDRDKEASAIPGDL